METQADAISRGAPREASPRRQGGAWYGPSIAALSCVAILFGMSWRQPFRVEGDVAYCAKAAQQYVRGEVSRINTLRLANPLDLSQDTETYIFWWPPAICAFFAGLMKLGVPLGESARLMMLTAAVSGAFGWGRIAARLGVSRLGGALLAIPILVYLMKSGMAYSFTTGDPLLFGIAPWLILLALDHGGRTRGQLASLCGLSVGCACLYWIKYSGLFLVAALGLTLAASFARKGRRLLSPRLLVHLSIFAVVVGLSVLGVTERNRIYGGGGSSIIGTEPAGTTASQFVVSVTAALGDVFLYVSPGLYRACGALGAPAWLFKLGVSVFAVASIWLVILLIRRSNPAVAVFCGAIVAIPLAALSYLTLHDPVSYLQDATRYCYPFWMFLQIALIAMLFPGARSDQKLAGPPRALVAAIAAGFAICLFVPVRYLGDWAVQNRLEYKTTASGTYSYNLSKGGDPLPVLSAIGSALAGGAGVVVPCTYGLGQDAWLEMDWRLAPLTRFWRPLNRTHGAEMANYEAAGAFHTDRPLRVALVATNADGRKQFAAELDRIKKRFPQARGWDEAFHSEGDGTSVWIADLAAR